ncbi:MAG: hypothetical protein C4346_12030 [Chloroflexota bacterium]
MTPVEYYEAVANRILPFLTGRLVTIEQRFRDGSVVYRRHERHGADRRPIRIETADEIVRWARQHAVAFHAHIKPEGPGAWFFLDIDSRDLPTEMARLGMVHTVDLVEEQGLAYLVKFSGADGFHLLWSMPDVDELESEGLWPFEQAIVQALADQVSRRLAADPRAQPIREAVGPGGPLVTTNALREDPQERKALLFDKLILKPNANARVPFSLHPATGLSSVPLTRVELEAFTEVLAEPERAVADRRNWAIPENTLDTVKHALARWEHA